MKYHACGALIARDSSLDGLLGFYHPSGAVRILDQDGVSIYDPSGALRISDQSLTATYVGKYSLDGRWNVTFVDGLTYTGVYAPNGSVNMFLEI